jgi:hypothetical protein
MQVRGRRRVDGVKSPRHRADAVAGPTSRRWRGGVRNLFSTRRAADHAVALDELPRPVRLALGTVFWSSSSPDRGPRVDEGLHAAGVDAVRLHFPVFSVMDLNTVQHQMRREAVRAPYKITLGQRALEGHHDGFRERHRADSREGRDAAEGLARQPGDCPRRLASRRRQVVRNRARDAGTNTPPTPLLSSGERCSRKSAFAEPTRLQLRNDGVRHGSSVLAMPRTNLQSQAERFAPESCSKPGRPSGL